MSFANITVEHVLAVTIPLTIVAILITLVLCLSRCEQSRLLAQESTSQEAIKAGLVQGEYNRWVKPLSLSPVEKSP